MERVAAEGLICISEEGNKNLKTGSLPCEILRILEMNLVQLLPYEI